MAWNLGPLNLVDNQYYVFTWNFFQSAELVCDPDMEMAATAFGGPGGMFADLLPYYTVENGKLKSLSADLIAASLFHVNGIPPEDRAVVYDRIIRFTGVAGVIGDDLLHRLNTFVLQLLVNDDLVPPQYVVAKTRLLLRTDNLRNLALWLRLLAKSPIDDHLVETLALILEYGEPTLEQVAEVWCALADKGIPGSDFPATLRDRAHDLRWPEREEPLAHRPDLLKRLSALEDGELL